MEQRVRPTELWTKKPVSIKKAYTDNFILRQHIPRTIEPNEYLELGIGLAKGYFRIEQVSSINFIH